MDQLLFIAWSGGEWAYFVISFVILGIGVERTIRYYRKISGGSKLRGGKEKQE